MTTYKDKRSYERYPHMTPIWLTRFNSGRWLEAQTLNHCIDGMCVQSHFYFQPGTPVLIRVKNYPPAGSCNYNFEGFPTINLGEVKWCRENPDTTPASYGVGVKYYPPEY